MNAARRTRRAAPGPRRGRARKMADGRAAAAELRFPSCSGAQATGTSPSPCAAHRAVAVHVRAPNAAAGRGLSSGRSLCAAFRRKRRCFWPCAAVGGRCGARWAAGGWRQPCRGQGGGSPFSPSRLFPREWGEPSGAARRPGPPAGWVVAASPLRSQLSSGRGDAGRAVTQPRGELGGRPGPGLGALWLGLRAGPGHPLPRPGRRVSRLAVPSGRGGGAGELPPTTGAV